MGGRFLEPGGALSGRLAGELLGRNGQPSIAVGTRLGPYRVLRELGRGGLGVVYLGERVDGTFEQQVALKLIVPDGDRTLTETLLARERRILAKLQHPGIARIIDGGNAEGVVWFAMDYVEGERIDRYCREKRLDGRSRLELLLKVGEAVAYAHARLVVHRDIKPANILVDAGGQPRLLDFGIAAALDEAEQNDPGKRAATPGFASPEQYRGEATGIAADVYQLGRLLKILMQDVAVADRRGLAAVERRALSEQPAQRYPNVEAFAFDLRNLLGHLPVAACGQHRGYRAALFLRRHRLGVLIALAATTAFLVTVGGFLWHLDAARDRANREAETAQRVAEFMVGVFDHADPNVHRGEKPDLDLLLARGRERIGRELDGEPALKGELLTVLGRVHLALSDADNAIRLLREAVTIGDADRNLPPERLAMRKYLLAQAHLVVEHRSPVPRTQLDEALALISGDGGRSDLHGAILREMDQIDCFDGEIVASIDRLTAAVADARGTAREDSEDFAKDLFYLGNYLQTVRRSHEAVPILEEALRRIGRLHGADHPSVPEYATVLAGALAKTGRHAEAEEKIRIASDRIFQVHGEQSARAAIALSWRGEVAESNGDHAAAIGFYRRAMQIMNGLPPENDFISATLFEGLGDAQMSLGDAASAEASYREMLARNRDGRRSLGPDLGDGQLKLARALAAQGQCGEALVHLQKAHERAAGLSAEYPIHADLQRPLDGCPLISRLAVSR